LLKCLSVVGAEFYYVGYFNLKQPFSRPDNYVWQAAMPAYAQAVATHYEDVFFNGNVIFNDKKEPLITYPVTDTDVLVAVRKHNEKEKYIITATVQPSSNTEKFPLQKNIEINLGEEKIKMKARRQGSVYVYDKSVEPALFYQLDRWHQYEHPTRWRKWWISEAEVFDKCSGTSNKVIHSVYIKENSSLDCSNAESFIQLNKQQWAEYTFSKRDAEHLNNKLYLMIFAKCKAPLNVKAKIGEQQYAITNGPSENWGWMITPFTIEDQGADLIKIRITAENDGILIDKLIISDSAQVPDLSDY
jgi:hypothetical protein